MSCTQCETLSKAELRNCWWPVDHPILHLTISSSRLASLGTLSREVVSTWTNQAPFGQHPDGVVLLGLCLAAYVINLDITIVNWALPTLVRERELHDRPAVGGDAIVWSSPRWYW